LKALPLILLSLWACEPPEDETPNDSESEVDDSEDTGDSGDTGEVEPEPSCDDIECTNGASCELQDGQPVCVDLRVGYINDDADDWDGFLGLLIEDFGFDGACLDVDPSTYYAVPVLGEGFVAYERWTIDGDELVLHDLSTQAATVIDSSASYYDYPTLGHGKLTYVSYDEDYHASVVLYDLVTGGSEVVLTSEDEIDNPLFDGTDLWFSQRGDSRDRDLYHLDLATGTTSIVADGDGNQAATGIVNDHIIWFQYGGTQGIYAMNMATEVVERLTTSSYVKGWTTDGEVIVFSDNGDLHVNPLDGSERSTLVDNGLQNEYPRRLGDYVAWTAWDNGETHVYMTRIDGTTEPTLIGTTAEESTWLVGVVGSAFLLEQDDAQWFYDPVTGVTTDAVGLDDVGSRATGAEGMAWQENTGFDSYRLNYLAGPSDAIVPLHDPAVDFEAHLNAEVSVLAIGNLAEDDVVDDLVAWADASAVPIYAFGHDRSNDPLGDYWKGDDIHGVDDLTRESCTYRALELTDAGLAHPLFQDLSVVDGVLDLWPEADGEASDWAAGYTHDGETWTVLAHWAAGSCVEGSIAIAEFQLEGGTTVILDGASRSSDDGITDVEAALMKNALLFLAEE